MTKHGCRERIALAYVLLALAAPAAAEQVVTCEREWAQLAGAIGGDRIDVESLASGNGDVHHMAPTARTMALVRRADLLLCSDIRHEAALRLLVQRSGNPRVQRGQRGYLEAGEIVWDRKHDDSNVRRWHHVERDPRNVLLVAGVLTERLQSIDPDDSEYYGARYRAFSSRWQRAMRQWEERARPLRGLAVIEQRKACAYLCAWLGVREIASLEEQGNSGGVNHMRDLLASIASDHVTILVKGPHHISPPMAWLERRTSLPLVTLPATDHETTDAEGLYTMFYDSIERMLAAVAPRPAAGRS